MDLGNGKRTWQKKNNMGQLPGIDLESKMSSILELKKSGQELVEFAIVLPFLLIVFIGVLDLGRVFHASITVANASRAGARFATSYGFIDNGNSIIRIDGDIKDRVELEAQNSGITIDRNFIDIACSSASCLRGSDSITVTVTYNFQLLFNSIIGTGFDLIHSSEMKIPW